VTRVPRRKSREAAVAGELDLDQTLSCGQVFHWRKQGGCWIGLIGAVPVRMEMRSGVLWVNSGTEDLVARYLALDHPLGDIYAAFPRDPAMDAALAACRGLRIVRQPAWECVATFITSALKQVPHIAQISHTLRERFGEAVAFEDDLLFAYPPPERLAASSEAELRACGLGFRAKNLLGAARTIAEGEVNLDELASMADAEARRELCRLPGVGEKVANCALLFGYERLAAFPIDTWIERILRQIYFARDRRVTRGRLRDFSASYFGLYGGYAQQYLFHHARMTSRRRLS
jgi:N-glycosylase/DNA lyase